MSESELLKTLGLFILCVCAAGVLMSHIERDSEAEELLAFSRDSLALHGLVDRLIAQGNATEELRELIDGVTELDLTDYVGSEREWEGWGGTSFPRRL